MRKMLQYSLSALKFMGIQNILFSILPTGLEAGLETVYGLLFFLR